MTTVRSVEHPPRSASAAVAVLKIGGRPLETESARASLASAVATFRANGTHVVLVHGGGVQVTEALKAAGVDAKFVDGLRVTDERTLAVAEPVFTLLGKQLAHSLTQGGAPAIAMTGRDARLLEGVVKDARLGRVGTIVNVDIALIRKLFDAGLTPVIGPIAVDASGALNVNADEVAAAVAAALGADELLLLTDVPAVRNSDGAAIASLTAAGAAALIDAGVATGGMIPKINGALEALTKGVECVRILDDAGLATLAKGGVAGTTFQEA